MIVNEHGEPCEADPADKLFAFFTMGGLTIELYRNRSGKVRRRIHVEPQEVASQ